MKNKKTICWLLTILFLLSCLSGCIQPGSLPGGTSGTGAEGTSAPLPEGSAFAVHFIDVGAGRRGAGALRRQIHAD